MNLRNRSPNGGKKMIGSLVLWSAIIAYAMFSNSSSIAQEPFDHFSTSFPLDGAHLNVTCEGCHSGASFKGTIAECVNCHSPTGLVRASSKPNDHVSSSEFCADCHTTAAWTPITYMDHASIMEPCVTCHNGQQATGKSLNHIVSSENCDDCHQTSGWLPAVFDHTNVVGGCLNCHDGNAATGKSLTHIQSTNTCEDCHTTTVWGPAYFVDHTQVIGTCA